MWAGQSLVWALGRHRRGGWGGRSHTCVIVRTERSELAGSRWPGWLNLSVQVLGEGSWLQQLDAVPSACLLAEMAHMESCLQSQRKALQPAAAKRRTRLWLCV